MNLTCDNKFVIIVRPQSINKSGSHGKIAESDTNNP